MAPRNSRDRSFRPTRAKPFSTAVVPFWGQTYLKPERFVHGNGTAVLKRAEPDARRAPAKLRSERSPTVSSLLLYEYAAQVEVLPSVKPSSDLPCVGVTTVRP